MAPVEVVGHELTRHRLSRSLGNDISLRQAKAGAGTAGERALELYPSAIGRFKRLSDR